MMKFESRKPQALGNTTKAVAKGLFQFAADVVNIAGQKAPVETGQLRQSGKVIPKSVLHIAVQFSRASRDGFNVAERMEFDESLNHPRGGQARYLGSTVELLRPRIREYVARYTN